MLIIIEMNKIIISSFWEKNNNNLFILTVYIMIYKTILHSYLLNGSNRETNKMYNIFEIILYFKFLFN